MYIIKIVLTYNYYESYYLSYDADVSLNLPNVLTI
jgi:hypothetical protein